MMKTKLIIKIVASAALFLTAWPSLVAAETPAQPAPAAGFSPENQSYQFVTTETFNPKSDPSMKPTTANAYLWIPPACKRVRGVLVLSQNVPEGWIAGHPAIRAACADNDLAIMWACRGFLMRSMNNYYGDPNLEARDKDYGDFVQQMLTSLAAKSGYAEIATVPWIPIGESCAIIVPTSISNARPERCIAAIQVKDGQWKGLHSLHVPVLAACGSGAEWNEPKSNVLASWKGKASGDYKNHCTKRTEQPEWPGSLLIEAGSAHFSCTDAMARLIAQYIRTAAKARLSTDGSATVRPVNLDDGYVAGLPVPGAPPVPPVRYKDCTPEQKNLPWYFDEASAKAAFDLANVNWNAQTQMPVFADDAGQPIPFNETGITGPLPIKWEKDGVTFTIGTTYLDKLPETFAKAGTEVGHPAAKPVVEWLCGSFVPLGNNRFQLSIDRMWKKCFCYVRVWHPGDATYRLSTRPGRIDFTPNKTGKPQKITFAAIPDQRAGMKEIRLHATSDSVLPVRFYVQVGPAEIHGDRLVFTPIPPRTKMPVTVTVGAWQWGRDSEPAVQTADIVERSFQILPRN